LVIEGLSGGRHQKEKNRFSSKTEKGCLIFTGQPFSEKEKKMFLNG